MRVFGRTDAGETVHRMDLEGGGLTASLTEWGVTLLDLRIEDDAPPLVLGYPNFADYPAYSPYFGATPGRYANRIAHGRFTLDGVQHQLDRNQVCTTCMAVRWVWANSHGALPSSNAIGCGSRSTIRTAIWAFPDIAVSPASIN